MQEKLHEMLQKSTLLLVKKRFCWYKLYGYGHGYWLSQWDGLIIHSINNINGDFLVLITVILSHNCTQFRVERLLGVPRGSLLAFHHAVARVLVGPPGTA
jgi:hypothetical protein